MKTFFYILLCLLLSTSLTTQAQIIFSARIIDEKIELVRSKTKKTIYSFTIESDVPLDSIFRNYTLSVNPNPKQSTLPLTDFEVDFREVLLSNLKKGYNFYLTLNANSELDRARVIQLDFKIKSSIDPELKNIKNSIISPDLQIKVHAIEQDTVLDQYNYLAYIGTNFDLVDGIQAKNLFFATNIYKMPKFNDTKAKNDVGFNITLYGNRALTSTDNLGTQTYTYKYVKIPNTETSRVFTNEGTLTESRVSDNLGAAFSPMFNVFHLANPERTLQILYAPQIEFVWRRYTTTRSYTDIRTIDSTKTLPFGGSDIFILTRPKETTFSNNYDVNLGLIGMFVSHETKNLSIRFQMAGGYSFRYINQRLNTPLGSIASNYKKDENFFFGVRLWITEAISGITLGAEVSNRLFKNYEPVYNVTLSKALSFKNIGAIFAPVTTR